MKKSLLLAAAAVLVLCLTSCKNRQEQTAEPKPPTSLESGSQPDTSEAANGIESLTESGHEYTFS